MSHALAHSTRSRRLLAVVSGGLVAAALAFGGWFAYLLYALIRGGTCLFGDSSTSGWGDTGLALAMFVGGALWLAGGVVALRRPGRTVRQVLWFAVIYGVSLVVIGLVSPLLWGPAQC